MAGNNDGFDGVSVTQPLHNSAAFHVFNGDHGYPIRWQSYFMYRSGFTYAPYQYLLLDNFYVYYAGRI